jgi:hypothetical protein
MTLTREPNCSWKHKIALTTFLFKGVSWADDDATDFDSLKQVCASGEASHEKESIRVLVDFLHLVFYEP